MPWNHSRNAPGGTAVYRSPTGPEGQTKKSPGQLWRKALSVLTLELRRLGRGTAGACLGGYRWRKMQANGASARTWAQLPRG